MIIKNKKLKKIKAIDSWRDGNKGRKLERKRVPWQFCGVVRGGVSVCFGFARCWRSKLQLLGNCEGRALRRVCLCYKEFLVQESLRISWALLLQLLVFSIDQCLKSGSDRCCLFFFFCWKLLLQLLQMRSGWSSCVGFFVFVFADAAASACLWMGSTCSSLSFGNSWLAPAVVVASWSLFAVAKTRESSGVQHSC